MARGYRWATILITVAGVGGMLGLFAAAHRQPGHALLFQAAAVVWFLTWGVVRTVFDVMHRCSGD